MKKQITTNPGLQKAPLLVLLLFFAIQSHATPFITTWKTDNPGTSGPNQILYPGAFYNSDYRIDWEEVGNPSNNGTLIANGNTTITFPSPGTYKVSAKLQSEFYFFNGGGDPLKLLTIEQWGSSKWENMAETFHGCSNMTYNATDTPDFLSDCISLENTFRDCTNFNGNIGGWNTSNITNMSRTFEGASSFNKNIGGWNTANVTGMDLMFHGATSFNQNIGGWNTSKVSDMRYMFYHATSFNQNIGNWNTSNVFYMSGMFQDATSFNQDIGNWNTSHVQEMVEMFRGATSFNKNIGGWNTEHVIYFGGMFSGATAFNQAIGGWNTGAAWEMQFMFSRASAFNQDIGGWNVSRVSDMSDMFLLASSFNQNLGSWTLRDPVHMDQMLRYCGMDCSHYDNTLIGWNANPATPNGLELTSVNGMKYWNADAARNNLITVKGWTIDWDELFNCYCVPPAFSACPSAPVTVNTLSNQCYGPASYTVTAPGNPAPTLTYTFTGATNGNGNGTGSGSNINKGNTTVSVKAELSCGASSTCQFNVTVIDATKPSISCPANATVTANASCSGTLGTYAPVSVSDNCTSNPTVTQSPASSTVLNGHNDSKTVTLTADDGNGNTQACTFTVTLKDLTKPSITCPANATVSANASCSGTVGTYAAVSVSDNCTSNPTVTQSPASSTVLNGHNDSKTVTLTANDGNGNTQTCSFTVTLKDLTKPSISCPANAIVAANASCNGTVGTYAAVSVSDNCTANPTVTQSPASSTLLNGHNDSKTVTLTADDGNGNTQVCTFTVTLKDLTKPSITCPANAIVTANASCGGTVGAFAPVSVSDNCAASPTVTQIPVSSTLLSGHNDSKTVTLTADDGNGNTQACSFTVTLKDQTKPSISCPANATITANASCSGTLGAYAAVSVSDNCNVNPTVTQSPASSTVLSGHNDSKTVTLTADDGNGNTQACSFTVTLKDLTKPSISCPANTTITANASCSGTLGAYAAVSVSDNCTANPTVTQSPASSTLLNGHNDSKTVTLTADDGNGNTQVCTFTVTLKDLTKPNITCPANAIVAANASCSGTIGAYAPVSVSDNCTANPTVTQNPVSSTVLNGHNDSKTVTLTAADGNGNTQVCSFTVTLKDQTGPSIICKPAIVNLNAAGTGSITTASVYQSGSDNCGSINLVSVAPSTFNCSNVGANNATLTTNDGNGNNGTCTATVTVVDPISPTLLCKNVTLNLDASGQATLSVSQINNGSYDNCSIVAFNLSQSVFTCSNLGSNNVTLSGKDQSGNGGQCTAVVTVTDPIKPVAKCKDLTANLGANGTILVDPNWINNGSSDNCSFTLSLTPNLFNCSSLGLNTVTLKATDNGGNTATCTAKVTVRDVTAPAAKCKNPTIYLDDSGHTTLSVAQVDNGSSDNCGMGSMSINNTAFDCWHIGSTQSVTLSMTDVNGNSASCVSNVTVKDALAPTAICEDVTVQLGANGTVVVYGANLASYSYDNCSVYSYSPIAKVYTAANLGANNLTITVKDWSSNAGTCVSVVTVLPAGNNNLSQHGGNGKSENHGFDDFNVYPNPSSGEATMAFQLPAGQAFSFRIFDLTGRMVYNQEGLGGAGENIMSLHLEGLIPGVYLIDFQSDNRKEQQRLVLQR